ncbi:MAG: ATP-binding cassette domain-containing protein [Actinomycetota bacterium]
MADRDAQRPAGSPPQPDALDDVVASLATTHGAATLAAPTHADPTADALAAVGATLGHPAVEPARAGLLTPEEGTGAASGWMSWRVRLTGRWFQNVPVPLLVRRDGTPAVVVPDGRRSLTVDGGTRATRPVGEREAEELAPEAVAFAVDLPRSTRWWSLVAWSLGRQRPALRELLILAIVTGLGSLVLPVTTGAVFGTVLPLGRLDLLLVLLATFALASIGLSLLALQRGRLVVRILDRLDLLLGAGVAARMLRLKAGFFADRTVGDVTSRALAVETARRWIDDAVVSVMLTSVFGLVSIGYLLAAGAAAALITAGTVAAVLAASVAVHVHGRRLLLPLLDRRSETDALLLSILANIVSWRAGAAEDRALARWAREQQASTQAMRARLRSVSLGGPIEFAAPTAVLAAFIVAVALFPEGALSPGSASAPGAFLAMYAALAQVTIAMIALTSNLLYLSEYGPQLSRVEPILTGATELDRSPPGALRGAVALHDVRFGYRRDRPPLLAGVSLAIEPGEFVALVGPSGGGKSTLLRLLLGFEDPWSGMVTYDGSALSTLDAASVRRQMGVVLQSSHPLGVTVRDCICGPHRLDDAALAAIVERAGLADDLVRMPLGLDTPVGEGGAGLSGGQRQRVMIAAAIAGDPAILLLDEATSALDNATQSVVMRTILESSATRIVIAHRLSTVRQADRILVIADGAIAESGTPAELMASGGLFAQLAARQEL